MKGVIIDAKMRGDAMIVEIQVEDEPQPTEYLELRKGLFWPLVHHLGQEGHLPSMSEKILMTGSAKGALKEG
ncbi:hypothetical protein HYY70_00425 [Candidatus Woesearchaeota archaeon]|nr:hypothetical protein [Candidatus Woesearchaeota archaeon]